MSAVDVESVAWDPASGLAPAIVQDADTRQVLMLAWMNPEALRITQETGRVTFWSRSRQELWEKGAISGNTLELVELVPDCDRDALLVTARPAGPACHTGTASCFPLGTVDWQRREPGFARLEVLWSTITDRASSRPEGSYTVRLLDGGPDLPARKVVEEATEILIAAKDHRAGTADDIRLAEEIADLVYHLLVLMRERGLDPSVVLDELAARETKTPRRPSLP